MRGMWPKIPAHGLPADQVESAQARLARCLDEFSPSTKRLDGDEGLVRDFRIPRFGPGFSIESD